MCLHLPETCASKTNHNGKSKASAKSHCNSSFSAKMPCLFQLLVISTANKDHAATLKWNTIGICYNINTHLLIIGVYT